MSSQGTEMGRPRTLFKRLAYPISRSGLWHRVANAGIIQERLLDKMPGREYEQGARGT